MPSYEVRMLQLGGGSIWVLKGWFWGNFESCSDVCCQTRVSSRIKDIMIRDFLLPFRDFLLRTSYVVFFLSPRDLPGYLTPDFSKFRFFSKSQTHFVISYSGQIFQSPKFFLSSKFFQSPSHRDFLLRTNFYVVLFISPRNFPGFLTLDNFYVVLFLSSIYVVTFSKSHLCSNFF